jgi:hypothetical protein
MHAVDVSLLLLHTIEQLVVPVEDELQLLVGIEVVGK